MAIEAKWNGEVIARAAETIQVEGNHYFPRSSVNDAKLKESDTTSHCPWKGDAKYYTVVADGKENTDAAFYYPDPKDKAAHIADHVAFWKGVEVGPA